MKHLTTNFVEQFDKIDPRKVMTKDTYKYISSLHRRYIFSDGKYGCRSNFIETLDRPKKEWHEFKTRVLIKKKKYLFSKVSSDINELNKKYI